MTAENCRYCGLEVAQVDKVVTHSYWGGFPFVCHRACKDAGVRAEAYECQVLDANCNDCRHYQRGKLAAKVVSTITTKDGRKEEVTHQPNVFIGGHCLKFDKPVTAEPNKWSGMVCFEHRRGFKT